MTNRNNNEEKTMKKLTKKQTRDRMKTLQQRLANHAVDSCACDHAFNGKGGAGLSCFVWVTFDVSLPGDKRINRVKFCVSGNSVDTRKVDAALLDIPGYVSHYINLD